MGSFYSCIDCTIMQLHRYDPRVHMEPADCVRGPEWCHIASELLLCHAGANDGFGCVVLSHTVACVGLLHLFQKVKVQKK